MSNNHNYIHFYLKDEYIGGFDLDRFTNTIEIAEVLQAIAQHTVGIKAYKLAVALQEAKQSNDIEFMRGGLGRLTWSVGAPPKRDDDNVGVLEFTEAA